MLDRADVRPIEDVSHSRSPPVRCLGTPYENIDAVEVRAGITQVDSTAHDALVEAHVTAHSKLVHMMLLGGGPTEQPNERGIPV
jgi:hypothetical protein